MAIDRKPAVGRILMRESILLSGYCAFGGRITKVSNTRIYYRDIGSWFRDDAIKYLDDPTVGVEKYVTNYAAVCDTLDEALALKAFDVSARQRYNDLHRQLREGWAELFTKEEPAKPNRLVRASQREEKGSA